MDFSSQNAGVFHGNQQYVSNINVVSKSVKRRKTVFCRNSKENESNKITPEHNSKVFDIAVVDSMPKSAELDMRSTSQTAFLDVTSNNNRENTQKINKGPLTCYKCNKSFPSQEEVVLHLKLIHNACASRDCSNISDFKMHSPVCTNRDFGCSVCDQTFSDKYLLLVHFNQHIDAAFHVCEICRDGFQQRKDLQRHLLQVHGRNVSLPVIPSHSKAVYQKCGMCSKYFKLFAEFEEHKLSCSSGTYMCVICKVSFTSSSSLDTHKYIEHKNGLPVKGYSALKEGKRYFCGICYLGFFRGDLLREHLVMHEIKVNYVCDVCHSSFGDDDELQEHYLLHIEEHYVLHDVIKQHYCTACQCTFKTQKQLECHLALKVCKHILESTSNLSHSSIVSNDNLACIPENSTVTSSATEFQSNNLVRNDNTNLHMTESQSNCENAQQNSMESDIPIADFDASEIPVYILKAGDELLNCDDKNCAVVIDQASLFVLQRGACASESRMPHIQNAEAYEETDEIDASLLENHMIQILDSSKLESCSGSTVDGKTLSTCQDLGVESRAPETLFENLSPSDHNKLDYILENNETFESAVACEDSEMGNEQVYQAIPEDVNMFSENEVSHIHESVISEQQQINSLTKSNNGVSRTHVCFICRQVFSSKTSLYLHMKGSHTGFDCYHCGDSFHSESDLFYHERVSHPTSFQCDLCDVSYPKEHLLKKHKRCAHGTTQFVCNTCDKSYVTRHEYEIHLMLHEGETPPTKCETCGKVYSSISNYVRHRAIHEGKSPPKKYICNICDQGFVARHPLKRHFITHMKKTALSYECPKCKMYFSQKTITKHLESHEDISQ